MFLTHQPEAAGCVAGAGTLHKCQRSQNIHWQHCTWKPGRRTALWCVTLPDPYGWSNARGIPAIKKREKTHTRSTYGPQLKSLSRQGAPSATAVAAACPMPCRLMALGGTLVAVSLLSEWQQLQLQPFWQRPKGRTVHFKWVNYIVCELYLN